MRPDTLAQSSDLEIIAPVDTFTSLNVANLVSTGDYVARISGAGEIDGDTPAPVLAEQASAHNASSVVVARHRSALSEALRGSVALKLRRLQPALSVVEVRDRTTFNTATD